MLGAQKCTPLTGSIGAGANSQPHRLAELVLHGTALSVMLIRVMVFGQGEHYGPPHEPRKVLRDELHRGIHWRQASVEPVCRAVITPCWPAPSP